MRKQAIIASICFATITSAHNTEVSFCSEVSERPDSLTVLQEVEVTERKESKSVTSAVPFQKIDAERIKHEGVTDISDAMRRLAGVNIRDYGGAGGMKTVSVRGLGASHTGVVYDGVSLSDSQTGEIDLSRYTLDNLRSISLYSGENDDIFIPARAASSSVSLFINTFDLPSVFNEGLHTTFRMKTGSFGYYNPFLRCDYNKDRLALSFNAEYIHTRNNYPFKLRNGDYVTTERRENSMMNSWKCESNIRYRFGSSSISGKLYYYDNSRCLPGPVIYYVTESQEHLRDRNFFGQLNYKGRLSDKISLSAITKFNWGNSRYNDVGGQYPGGMLDNNYIQREAYVTAAVLYLPKHGFSLDYSFDWYWNNLTTNSDSKGKIGPYRNSVLQSLAFKYSVGRFSVLARLLYSLYLNGAKNGEAGKDESRLSPSLNISYRVSDDIPLYVRASYKNIFRVPTFNEAYFDNYGSLNLEPEITDQLNLGITYSYSNSDILSNLTLTADAYYNRVTNKIVALPYNMFLWTMSNLGKVRILGLETNLSATVELTSKQKILLTGTYSLQDARTRTSRDMSDWNNQVAYTPVNSGSFSLSWLNPWVDTSIHTIGCGSRYTTNKGISETRLSGYFDTGITLSHLFRLRKCSIECRGDVMNIFNKQYEIVARYPMPGRAWKIGLTLEF